MLLKLIHDTRQFALICTSFSFVLDFFLYILSYLNRKKKKKKVELSNVHATAACLEMESKCL